jgi:hypothetical protein
VAETRVVNHSPRARRSATGKTCSTILSAERTLQTKVNDRTAYSIELEFGIE